VLAELLPDEPEALGLAALVCLSESRRAARRGPNGQFRPLEEHDPRRWDAELIARGEELLNRAHGFGRPGRYQYEAAIQSAHCTRPVDWQALRKLHRALVRVAPSLGAAVASAAVDAEIDGSDVGLATLDAITDPAVERFQPAWATRAHLLVKADRTDAAAGAYRRAIELTIDPVVADYLRRQLAALA
jgi:predicted RNA polymerase sigma factor